MRGSKCPIECSLTLTAPIYSTLRVCDIENAVRCELEEKCIPIISDKVNDRGSERPVKWTELMK